MLVQDEYSSVKLIEQYNYESENQEIKDLLVSKQSMDSIIDDKFLNSHIDYTFSQNGNANGN